MKKIQLTEAEIKTIEAYKNDEINTYSPENPEDQKNLDSVINKAEELLDEYPDDEFDDLVLWVYDKYNQQQEAEIKTIEAYKNDEINTYSPENPEDQKNLDSVINKAEELLDEYPDDEFDDLVLWVYDKYNQQQEAEAAK